MTQEDELHIENIVNGYVEWRRSVAYSNRELPEPITETYAKAHAALAAHDAEVRDKALTLTDEEQHIAADALAVAYRSNGTTYRDVLRLTLEAIREHRADCMMVLEQTTEKQ